MKSNTKKLEKNKEIIMNSITFVSNYLPRYDIGSSNTRVFNIIKILLKLNFKITYFYFKKTQNDDIYKNSIKKVKTIYLSGDPHEHALEISNTNPTFLWLTNLWTVDFFHSQMQLMEEIQRSNLKIKVIIDTMDYHAKKYYRKYKINNSIDDLIIAEKFNELEKVAYSKSDAIFVVSEDEKKDISALSEKISPIYVIPNIYENFNFTQKFENRKNIAFLGNFHINHNIDAVYYFIRDIFPKILEKDNCINFHIIGNHSDIVFNNLNLANVKAIGHVQNLNKELSKYRVFVCPLTYGAGMKGKIGDAMSSGLPIVTTYLGAEGYNIKDDIDCFITDNSEIFASKTLLLYKNKKIWEKFSSNCLSYLRSNYTHTNVSSTISNTLNKIKNNSDSLTNPQNIMSSIVEKKHYPMNKNYLKLQDGLLHIKNLFFKKYLNSWKSKLELYESVFDYYSIIKNIESPEISIVIISWRKHPDTFKNLTILKQNLEKNFEIIFVNNGANDEDFFNLLPYIDSYIRLFKNTGAYIARNIGSLFAKSNIILFLEDDGIPDKNLINAHIDCHNDFDIIALRGVCFPKTSNKINSLAGHYYLGPKEFPWYSSLEGNSSYKSDIFFQSLGWNDNIQFGHGGRELSIRISKIEPDLRKQIYSPKPILYHDYATDKQSLIKKIEKQTKTLKYLHTIHNNWRDYFKKWNKFKFRYDLVLHNNNTIDIHNRDKLYTEEIIEEAEKSSLPAKVDFLACEKHHFDHLYPIWSLLPNSLKGHFFILTHKDKFEDFNKAHLVKNTIIANTKNTLYKELEKNKYLLVTASFYDDVLLKISRPMTYVAHGCGQTYIGQYEYQFFRKNFILDLLPNSSMAYAFKNRYPYSQQIIIGSPKLDKWYGKKRNKSNSKPNIAISFHFDRIAIPESRSSWAHFKTIIPSLAKQNNWHILGHGHPRMMDTLRPVYEKYNIEVVENFEDIMDRADLYICDHMSTLYEFASTNRPVIVLNAPWYRKDIEHGLRFWKHSNVGLHCDDPSYLFQTITDALKDSKEVSQQRSSAVQAVLTHIDGQSSQRASNHIQKAILYLTKNSTFLYPGTDFCSISDFINNTKINKSSIENRLTYHQSEFLKIFNMLKTGEQIHHKDLEFHIWALAILLIKTNSHQLALQICHDYTSIINNHDYLGPVLHILDKYKTNPTNKKLSAIRLAQYYAQKGQHEKSRKYLNFE